MATHMGVDAEPFTTLYQDQMMSIRLHFIQYIKDLQQRKQMPADDMPVRRVISITPRGFPLVPDIAFEDASKDELEDMMRDYLSKHYSMAFDTFDCYI